MYKILKCMLITLLLFGCGPEKELDEGENVDIGSIKCCVTSQMMLNAIDIQYTHFEKLKKETRTDVFLLSNQLLVEGMESLLKHEIDPSCDMWKKYCDKISADLKEIKIKHEDNFAFLQAQSSVYINSSDSDGYRKLLSKYESVLNSFRSYVDNNNYVKQNNNEYIYEKYTTQKTDINFVQLSDSEIVGETFHIEKQPYVLIFTSNKCEPCRSYMESIIAEEAYFLKYIDTIYFVETSNMNEADKNIIKERYNISQVPAVIFLNKDGKCIDKFVGISEFILFTQELKDFTTNEIK